MASRMIDNTNAVRVDGCASRAEWNRWMKLMCALSHAGLPEQLGERIAEAGAILARYRIYAQRDVIPGYPSTVYIVPDGDGWRRPLWRALQSAERVLWQLESITDGYDSLRDVSRDLKNARKAIRAACFRAGDGLGV